MPPRTPRRQGGRGSPVAPRCSADSFSGVLGGVSCPWTEPRRGRSPDYARDAGVVAIAYMRRGSIHAVKPVPFRSR